jgi:hypothetical protein
VAALYVAANMSAMAQSHGCGGLGLHAAHGWPGCIVASDIPLGHVPGPVSPSHTTSVPSQRWRQCNR